MNISFVFDTTESPHMPAKKKHMLEDEQFLKNKRRKINTIESKDSISISYHNKKDSSDNSADEEEYSSESSTEEEEYSLVSSAEEKEYSLISADGEIGVVSIYLSELRSSPVSEQKALLVEILTSDNTDALETFISHYPSILFEDFLFITDVVFSDSYKELCGDAKVKLDVLTFAVKGKCHPQMIEILFHFINTSLRLDYVYSYSTERLKQFDFYELINSMMLISPELETLPNKLLSLVIDLDNGEIMNKLLITAIKELDWKFIDSLLNCAQNKNKLNRLITEDSEQLLNFASDHYAPRELIDRLADSINQIKSGRSQSSPLLRNTFLKNNSSHPRQIKNKFENEALSESLWILKLECLLEEKNRLVKWIADEDNHNVALVNSIQNCIKYFRELLEDPLLDTKYKAYTNDLMAGCERLTSASKMLPSSVPPSDDNHITYLVPCTEDLIAMASLCAGAKESQMQRLGHISHILKNELGDTPSFQTRTSVTQHAVDRLSWQLVFKAIKLNDVTLVKAAFAHIPKEDLLLKALLEVHSYKYLLDLAVQCAELEINEDKEIHADVVCSHLTFEVLITDLISTLEQRRDINFSFGLPTHHAYREHPAGFCMINKVAALFAYEQLIAEDLLEAFFIGFDVNRDDGLNETSMNLPVTHSITHIDIHDSRVYPWHDASTIDEILGINHHRQDNMNVWEKENKSYKTIDLAESLREGSACHPALVTALNELESSLKNAQKSGKKIIIFLPTGWDSHCEEQAPCGRMISQSRYLSKEESEQCRFTDEDINYFNHELNQLYNQYKANINRIYWQLEGGYTPDVNKRQIINLVDAFQPDYVHQSSMGLSI